MGQLLSKVIGHKAGEESINEDTSLLDKLLRVFFEIVGLDSKLTI